ncbi:MULTISPECIES: CYTH domain-containing protein [unclassified Rhizobium]|uniref:CYTH domain-containing protein n=1 Tax=unclassified Rhizobium TaxID=2613769 RepID=UPI0007128932|nr:MULTISPECIES: CYTH domain-containing protein [unclassified Rhizobium]KQS89630.1 adenylate cyclase [Rhizobium sp. Leaf391]KQS94910.1 adenylate cyclase [Rhizobium sp. Leaf386]KQU01286.1 adenylate cyclase [Rhizobium sp. Leaf453]
MAKEIERKFLVASNDWRSNANAGTALLQAYIVTMDGRSLRVRLMDGKRAKLTIKLGSGAMTRDEFEYEIPVDDARELMSKAIGLMIEKTRYEVEYDGFTWEIDVYSGAHDGLVIAEVELKAEDDEPRLPDWLGAEVTGDFHYSNQYLSTEPLFSRTGHGLSYSPL